MGWARGEAPVLHARTAQNAGPLGSRLSVKGSTFDRSPSRTDLAVCQSGLDSSARYK